MHLLIDGYNLLHVGRSPLPLNPSDLQREREQLLDRLSSYRRTRPCQMTVVFDGWQGGWTTEKREMRKGIEVIFSRLNEKADEVIKRLIKEKGSGTVVITSDREISRYAEKIGVAVIPSDPFREKTERSTVSLDKGAEPEEEERGRKRKGPSKRPSKKERRARAALKKL